MNIHVKMNQEERQLWINVYIMFLRRVTGPLSVVSMTNKEIPDESIYVKWAGEEATKAVKKLRFAEIDLCDCSDCRWIKL